MKKAYGIVEILLAFLIMTLVVAGCMQLALVQMEEERLQRIENQESERYTNQSSEEKIDGVPVEPLQFEEVDFNNLPQ